MHGTQITMQSMYKHYAGEICHSRSRTVKTDFAVLQDSIKVFLASNDSKKNPVCPNMSRLSIVSLQLITSTFSLGNLRKVIGIRVLRMRFQTMVTFINCLFPQKSLLNFPRELIIFLPWQLTSSHRNIYLFFQIFLNQ